MGVNVVTSASEFNKHTGGTKLTVVDFSAEWCGPCKVIAPKFEELSSKYKDVIFLKVDVDQLQSVAQEHSVRAMPTFLFFKSGKKLGEVVGANITEVESKIRSLASGSGPSTSSKGYVLGTGKVVGDPSTTENQKYFIFALIAFGVFYWWNNRMGGGASFLNDYKDEF